MSKQKELVKNTLIIAIGKLSTKFLTFLLLPLYTYFLTTSEVGLVDVITVYVSLLAPIVMLSLEMSIFRYLVDVRGNRDGQRAIITNALHMIGIGLLAFSLLYLILLQYVKIPYADLVYYSIVSAVIMNTLQQVARGFGDNKRFAIGGIAGGLVAIAFNVILIVGYGMGARGMLIAMAAGYIASATYLFVALRLHNYIGRGESDAALKRELLHYSLPLVPNSISWWVINAADRTIITLFLGVASNGIYAVAYKFPLIFNTLFSFFGMSWQEAASVHINAADRDKFFSQAMNASVRLYGSLGVMMIAGVPLIFNFLVADGFREAYIYIPALVIGAFMNSIVYLYSAIYIAKKLTKQVLYTSVSAAVTSVIFTVALIPHIGLYAPAVALGIAYLGMAVFRHADVSKYVKITYRPGMIVHLIGMYIVATYLYYIHEQWSVLLNVILIGLWALYINKNTARLLLNKALHKLRRTI